MKSQATGIGSREKRQRKIAIENTDSGQTLIHIMTLPLTETVTLVKLV